MTFTVGSARIVVCGYCRTVVAREGEALLARGRMAALAETQTPFRLGLEGRWSQAAFTIVGHLQKDYGAGVWDEWYLAFADGREGWLSESEGALHLMFSRGEEPALSLDLFRPGHDAYVGGKRVVVEEVRRARTASAAGQLPSDVKANASTVAVDATGPGGVFVTYDFGERQRAPEIFVGRRVRLEDLGIPASELVPRKPKRARLQAARCPKCQGPLELKAPDAAMRVACPFCGSLLDASSDKLAFLQALQPPDHPPKLALGSSGKLAGKEWMVIGFMVRSCTVDGVRYPWDEYLLWSRENGFSFLMDSNGHWTHLVPLPAGEVRVSPGTAAYYGHTRYRAFQEVQAVTETVQGEFYWQVRAGERAEATEYVAPPHSINVDATEDEVTYTHGTWLPPEEIEKAFALRERLPRPHGVAPAQPYPQETRVTSNLRWLVVYAALGVLLYAIMKVTAAEQVVLKETFMLDPQIPPGTPEAMRFSDPFPISQAGNLRVRIATHLSNDWLGVQGDLVREEDDQVVSFYVELSRYHGVSGGESWSEGSDHATVHLSRLQPGRYTLRLVPSYQKSGPNRRAVAVELISDVPRLQWLVIYLLVLGGLAAFNLLRRHAFESRRWSESNLGNDE